MADLWDVTMPKLGFDVVGVEVQRTAAFYFYISKSFVIELWRELIQPFARKDNAVGLKEVVRGLGTVVDVNIGKINSTIWQ